MVPEQQVSAWRPDVPGVVEVFHARFTEHAYPMHVHDVWTLLIVDDGAVRYDLDRHEHGTPTGTVSLLPPHVPHNGSPTTSQGFRKRVLYLDSTLLDERLIGSAVDNPDFADPLLRRGIGRLHGVLGTPGDEFEAESRLTLITERLRGHLSAGRGTDASGLAGTRHSPDRGIARRLRELLDESLVEGVSLGTAADRLHTHPAHLVRSFSGAFGMPPHQYLVSRRVDLARRLLLAGHAPGEAAVAAGFCDQPHLTRHFKRFVGVTPGRYRRSVA